MTDSKRELTAERLREVLSYDPDTGFFTWTARTSPFSRVNVGDVAGNLRRDGYIEICVDGRKHQSHRIAWLYVYGEWPADQIDHINGIRTDNRIANLREANNAENHHNLRKARSDSTTGFLGVTRSQGKFKAQIQADGKKMHIGCFDTPEAAHEAYLAAKRKLHSHNTL